MDCQEKELRSTYAGATAVLPLARNSWGATTTGTQAAVNPFTYAGGYNDTTNGLVKFGARYYNPTQGRFTQPDPSGQENNRYTYAGCNPINYTDPLGLFTPGDFFAIVGLTLGIAALFTLGPELALGWSLVAVASFWGGIGGAGYQFGCDASPGC